MVKSPDAAHECINANINPINLKPHTRTDYSTHYIGGTVALQLNSDFLYRILYDKMVLCTFVHSQSDIGLI